MNVTVLYVGSSLLAPLKHAERELNREYKLELRLAAHNFGSSLTDAEWQAVNNDLSAADIVFVIHVMDGENAARLILALENYKQRHAAVIVINCMGDLMRRTRMGRLDVMRFAGSGEIGEKGDGERVKERKKAVDALALLASAGSWVGRQVRRSKVPGSGPAVRDDLSKPRRLLEQGSSEQKNGHGQYLKWIDKLPGILRFVPAAGGLRDVKHYLNIFCYFLQPTPANIRSMVLYALKEYVADERLRRAKITVPPPERMPSVAIYHPDAPKLFETFAEYQKWYKKSPKFKVQSPKSGHRALDPAHTIGLLLMRPQVVSKTTRHYDTLIRAIEAEGLSVVPALSTLMDNREAVSKFFVRNDESNVQDSISRGENKDRSKGKDQRAKTKVQTDDSGTDNDSRVSQIVSLTGFSFVGGPAMNDSEAAAEFLQQLNRPYRSAVSLDSQTIDAWRASQSGLNPVQAGMQIAIPEIDGATEPFVYGGIQANGVEPVALDDRCERFARRLRRWNRLRTAARSDLRLALTVFCFPPNKGNIGTAADLDVFPSVWDTLGKLQSEGYQVEPPASADALRGLLIGGNSERFAANSNVAYRMSVAEYRRLCPYVDEVEKEWGPAPGRVNSFDGELLIHGVQLGSVFIGVQPTFGYEGDPMRLMMARSGAPHHGFMAFYTYLQRVLNVDAVVHVGTHGALEFMPGKQVGLSGECWPDRLIGELPNIYIYSVNNPSEGSIAKRRSYAELISYLTPPIENAGLYRGLATLKDLVMSYRQSPDDVERAKLFESIEEYSSQLNLNTASREMRVS
ncbi:MAG TPA: cobaltochelatase subunit CobN [Pyrinomonadaceae bacterium]|nr:cobaltochelatase subunit CobN [Pyrinomonadaceae bacterium]